MIAASRQREWEILTDLAIRRGWPHVHLHCPACGSDLWPVMDEDRKCWSCPLCSTMGLFYPEEPES